MKIIMITNNPSARAVFELALKTNAPKILDFRNVTTRWFSHDNGLPYSLGNRYTRVRYGFFIVCTLKCLAGWAWPNLPLIIIVSHDTPNDTLRFAIWSKFP